MAAEGTDLLGNIVESCLINEENCTTNVITIDPDCVKIVEEPVKRNYKFRHLSELENQYCMKQAPKDRRKKMELLNKLKSQSLMNQYSAVRKETIGDLLGVSSNKAKRTYPSILLNCDYKGPVTIDVSCVEDFKSELPEGKGIAIYRPHPHILTGDCNLDGIHYQKTVEKKKKGELLIDFKFGIMSVRRDHMQDTLIARHGSPQAAKIPEDLKYRYNVSAMRLCFQVYLGGLGDLPLNPVYSDIIYSSHDRQHRNLKIEKKSSNWAPIQCGKEILLFCSTAPENVKVYFSFSDTEQPIEALNVKVHHGFGISFTSPQYKDPFCKNIIHAEIYLHKMAKDDDNDEDMMSAKEDFYFVPNSYIQEPTKEDLQAAKFHAEGKNPSKCEPEPSTINESGGEEAIIDFQALLDLDLDPFDPNNVGVVPDENPNISSDEIIKSPMPPPKAINSVPKSGQKRPRPQQQPVDADSQPLKSDGTITIPPKQSQPQSRQASNLDKMETAPSKNIAKMGLIESIISGVSEDDIKNNFFSTTNTSESGPESEELAKYLGISENPIVNESFPDIKMLSDDLSKLNTEDLVFKEIEEPEVVVLPDELRVETPASDTTAQNTTEKVLSQFNEKFLNSDLNSDV